MPNRITRARPNLTVRSQQNLVAGVDYLAPGGSGSQLTGLTAAQIGLGNVENVNLSALPAGFSIVLLSPDGTKQILLYCGNDGKLHEDKVG